MLIAIVSIFILGFYLVCDFKDPKYIRLKSHNDKGIKCLRAKELIVQEFDEAGNLWASRGMTLYCLKTNEAKFRRIARIPATFPLYWLNNFDLFRKLTNKPECLEATITGRGDIFAFSSGYIWHRHSGFKKFKKVFKISHFGFGVGRGILSNGLLSLKNNNVYFGEYFRNPNRIDVRIYKCENSPDNWSVKYNFSPGKIRHIHAIQEDPFTPKLWFCSGDDDTESIIGWSDDDFQEIDVIGKGSQIWRTTQLVFKKDSIYWGTDTGSEELSGIYRWERSTNEITRIYKSKGAILFGNILDDGTMVFTIDREGFPNEKDHKTRIIHIDVNEKISEIEVGNWKVSKKGFRYSFAMLRLSRNNKTNILPVSVINQKEFSMGELLLFRSEDLANHFSNE